MFAQKTLACMLLLAAPVAADEAAVTPIEKVIQMLNGMKVKGEKDMAEEAKVHDKYVEWVDDQSKDMGFQLQTANTKIEELTAFIDKADSDVATLSDEIADLDSEIARLEGEKKDATDIRTSEKAEFLKIEQDYSESVDALGRAIQVVSSSQGSKAQGMMLLQKMTKTTPAMKRVMAAFDQASSDEMGAPAAAAFEGSGGGVIAMLEGLLEKFKGELSAAQEEESNKAHDYDLTIIHLTDTIAKCNVDRDEKAAAKASTAAESAKAKGELADTKTLVADTNKVLRDMKAEAKTKSATFAENQKVRGDELVAIAKAIEIMSSPDVQGGSLVQQKAKAQVGRYEPAFSFVQMSSDSSPMSKQQKAAEFLKKRAGASNSALLAQLGANIMASPFAKVITMIEDMLAKLKEEAAAEADHKGWCDEQLKENKLKRNKKTAAVERLTADDQQFASNIKKMGKDIKTLLEEQSQLTKAMKEATELRETEKKENTAIIADSKAGKEATKKALVVLREFYAKQSAFLQESGPAQSGAAGGVVGMLEVIETDFARLEADTTAEEKAAASEYDQFMEDSQADKKAKHELEVKTKLEKDTAEFDKSENEKDLKAVQEELTKANEYFEYLKPSCLEVKVSYEERVAARKAELESLNEAYDILATKA